MEPPDPSICTISRSNRLEPLSFPLFASGQLMHNYRKQQPQRQNEMADFRRRKAPTDDRSTTSKKMRREYKEKNANDTSISTTSALRCQGSSWRSRTPRAGINPLTINTHKSFPSAAVDSSCRVLTAPPKGKVANWRLACFMAREYLSRGTLLGKPWMPHDSNANACTLISSSHENTSSSTAKSVSRAPRLDNAEKKEPPESAREKERLYSVLATDLFRSDDVHIPGIVNPSQLAAWLAFD